MNSSVTALFCLLVSLSFLQGKAKIDSIENTGPLPSQKPEIIYVQSFALDSETASPDQEKTGILGRRQGILGNRLGNGKQDPAEKTAELTTGIQQAIISSLNESGYVAQPDDLMSGNKTNVWLVKGEFTEVDSGNRIQRAVIGFGAGKAQMETQVQVYDLSRSTDEPFLVMGSHAQTGRAPGAVLMMNPYVLIAKFVLSKNADKKEVRKTGKQIADALVKAVNQTDPPTPSQTTQGTTP